MSSLIIIKKGLSREIKNITDRQGSEGFVAVLDGILGQKDVNFFPGKIGILGGSGKKISLLPWPFVYLMNIN
jgi:hypothetical protein